MDAYVIFRNDQVISVVIGTEEAANTLLRQHKEEHYKETLRYDSSITPVSYVIDNFWHSVKAPLFMKMAIQSEH